MPLLAGDIRLARSANMADVPEGGGPPSAQLLTSGRSNEIFPDISEETRTVGRVEIYQIFGVLRNTDRAALTGSNVILAQPPADPNVSVTLLSLKDPFATRADIARRIESGMSAGSEWAGYLLENHFTTMRAIQVLQRPGMLAPTLGKTYVLVYQEGQSGERRQRIRIKATSTEVRTFTQVINGQLTDFPAQVTTCELFDGLLFDFPGSAPTRSYARESTKTLIRETIYSDSGMFYGAGRLTAATAINDVWLQVDSVYTQVVPNSRSEAALVDQQPSARRTIVLADAPRRIEVGITPHTQRFKIDEANAGLTFVFQCKPLPEPGTVFIDYWALGQRYTITDNAEGQLVGQGGGAVSYLTGSINVTLKAVPDIGSSITLAHGERTAYTNRSSQGASVRAPEYCWMLEHSGVVPGTIVITWTSGGVLRTATDDGAGKLTGNATGVVDYTSGTVLMRPGHMPDAGAELDIDYQTDAVVTDILTPGGVNATWPDAGGYSLLTLSQPPVARSLAVSWVTARQISVTSGGTETVGNTAKSAVTESVPAPVPAPAPAPVYTPAPGYTPATYIPPAAPLGWNNPRPPNAIHRA